MRTLGAHYYDLGIMHQTVYNSFQSIQSLDFSRVLEMTDVEKPIQIKRMAIHNDMLLLFLAPFYFLYSGPETLLIIQTLAIAIGGIILYGICQHFFWRYKYGQCVGVGIVLSYLLYPAVQRANQFDFHAVVLTIPLFLGMFFFALKRSYAVSFICFLLALLAKEQVSLTTAFFGLYFILFSFPKIRTILPSFWKSGFSGNDDTQRRLFGVLIFTISIIWFVLSMKVIIPFFRGSEHFALGYYDSPALQENTFQYLTTLFGPLFFLPLVSLPELLIALPEFAINLVSNSNSMTNIYFHYTAVIIPFIFVSAVYSLYRIAHIKPKLVAFLMIAILASTAWFVYADGPLPFSKRPEIKVFAPISNDAKHVQEWAERLKDENVVVSTTGQLAPFFTSRRVFYLFSDRYKKADYVLIRVPEITSGFPGRSEVEPAYKRLKSDLDFTLVYKEDGIEVYKRL